jgi:hypothetical protein
MEEYAGKKVYSYVSLTEGSVGVILSNLCEVKKEKHFSNEYAYRFQAREWNHNHNHQHIFKLPPFTSILTMACTYLLYVLTYNRYIISFESISRKVGFQVDDVGQITPVGIHRDFTWFIKPVQVV